MAEEIERDCVELGSEGRLIRLQLEELFATSRRQEDRRLRLPHLRRATTPRRSAAGRLQHQDLLGFEELAELLGFPRANPLDHASPRGYRVLSHIPRLADDRPRSSPPSKGSTRSSARRTASSRPSKVLGPDTGARHPRGAHRRLQEHNLVERYLQL